MSFFGFNVAGSALEAYQLAEDVTANNIANVQTPGASRQVANLRPAPATPGSPFYSTNPATGLGTRGGGVLVGSITRVHQDSYDALFRGASSSQNFFDIQQQVLKGTQSALGEPNSGINAAFAAFQTAAQTLTNNPQGIPERNGVLTTAQGLVTSINSAGAAVQTSKTQVQQQARALIATVNNITDQIAALNAQIRASKAIGDNPNSFQDERDQLIDRLSGYISTVTTVQANGSTLVTIDGKALVNDTIAYHLAAPVIGTSSSPTTLGVAQLKIGLVGDPTPSNPVAVKIGGGQVGGLVDLYNNKLIAYGNQLDNFASALTTESARLAQGSYDLTGQAGGPLFTAIVPGLSVTAGNIKLGIATATELPAATASTAAGVLVTNLNAANNTVDTTAALTGNATLSYPPPAAGLAGTITVNVDGITQAFAYNTGAGGNAATINGFITNFNTSHFGVTASFDATAQKVIFARDPANIDLVHRAAQLGNSATPAFTITDSLPSTVGAALGTAATSLLMVLGAGAISGVQQNSTNAFGSTSAGGANALLSLFNASLGSPALQTTSAAASVAGVVTVTGAQFAAINVGDVLTIGATATGAAPQENVTVTGVDRTGAGKITFTAQFAHVAGFSITTAQMQTLQQSYANFVAGLGLDTQTAITGTSTQTALSSNVDKVRQGVDGINIDEETQNLIKFQNAYAAAAHTISVLDTLLRDAVNLGGGSF